MIYECIDCEQHYCTNCDAGGEDSCPDCHTGPRCNDCAVEHASEHAEEAPPRGARGPESESPGD